MNKEIQRKNKVIFSIIATSIIMILIGFILVYNSFFSISWIKGQEVIAESSSPNNTYIVYAYRNNGGAAVDFAVLGVVKNNKTGKTKNIYWQYHCSDAKITWKNENTVIINGVELQVEKDVYDYRQSG